MLTFIITVSGSQVRISRRDLDILSRAQSHKGQHTNLGVIRERWYLKLRDFIYIFKFKAKGI